MRFLIWLRKKNGDVALSPLSLNAWNLRTLRIHLGKTERAADACSCFH